MPDAAALQRRLASASAAGEPTLLALVGDGAVALAQTLVDHPGFVHTLALGSLPEQPVVWLHDGPGARIQADLLVADLALWPRPGIVICTGDAVDGGHPQLVVRHEVDGIPTSADGATRIELGAPLGASEVVHRWDIGDLTTAHAHWEQLPSPERDRLRWLDLARRTLTGRAAEVREHAYRRTPHDDVPALLFQVALADYKRCDGPALRSGMEALLAHEAERPVQDARFLFHRYRSGPRLPRRFWPSTPWLRWEHVVAANAHGEHGAMPANAFTRALQGFTGGSRRTAARAFLTLGHLDDAASLARLDGADPRVTRNLVDLAWSRRHTLIGQALDLGRLRVAEDALASIVHRGMEYRRPLELAGLTVAAHAGHAARVQQLLDGELHPRTAERELAALERRTRQAPLACRTAILGRIVDSGTPDLATRCRQQLGALPSRPVALGPYLLDEVIGEGGMGAVWAGRHADLDLEVAVKLLRTADVDGRWLEAFRREVEVATRLDHRSIVKVLDFGTAQTGTAVQSGGAVAAGQPFLVMERVAGGGLGERARGASFEVLARWTRQLLEALAYAHAKGLLHRDVKPENALIGTDGDLRLADFGLAGLDADARVGTPAFMAPELFRGAHPSIATDLYAVGCTLWCLVTGLPPFLGSPEMLARAHLTAPLPSLEPTVPVPTGLEALLRRWLARAPGDRPHSAAQAIEQLAQLEETPREAAAPHPAPRTQETFALETLLGDDADAPAMAPPVLEGSTDRPVRWEPRAPVFHARPPTVSLLERGDPLVVGNTPTRKALCALLEQARQTREPVRVAFEGPAGMGRQTLIETTLRQAHEQGAFVRPSLLVVDADHPTHTLPLRPLTVAQLCTVARTRVPVSVRVAVRAAARAAGRPAVLLLVLEGWRQRPGFTPGPIGLRLQGDDDPGESPARRWWADQVARLDRARREPILLAATLFDGFEAPTFARIAEVVGCDPTLPADWLAFRPAGHGVPPELQVALRAYRHHTAALHEAASAVPHDGMLGSLRRAVHQAWHDGDSEALRHHAVRHAIAADPVPVDLADGALEALDRHLDPDADIRRWLWVTQVDHRLRHGQLAQARRWIRPATQTRDPRLAALARGTYSLAIWSNRYRHPFRDDEIRALLDAVPDPADRARIARAFVPYCATRFPALHDALLDQLRVWAPDVPEVHSYHAIRLDREAPLIEVMERFGDRLSSRDRGRLLEHRSHYALEREAWAEGLALAEAALAADGGQHFARLNRALALVRLERPDQARRAAREAAEHGALLGLDGVVMLSQLVLLGLCWDWLEAWWNDLASITVPPNADRWLRDPTARPVLRLLRDRMPPGSRRDRYDALIR